MLRLLGQIKSLNINHYPKNYCKKLYHLCHVFYDKTKYKHCKFRTNFSIFIPLRMEIDFGRDKTTFKQTAVDHF